MGLRPEQSNVTHLSYKASVFRMSGEFPVIKSAHSLVAKHVTKERWDKVKDIETKTCGFTIAKARCEELAVQPRGTKGESGGQTGHTYDISNKHRLGYSEVQLVQVMIDAVNTLWKEDL